ncbi:MAG: hypothetical protein E6G56_07395 [Actinobacteria bacterium]|nr:MAG: hypothetical protein E6G56_07395 [Actinomycetota bacterium]
MTTLESTPPAGNRVQRLAIAIVGLLVGIAGVSATVAAATTRVSAPEVGTAAAGCPASDEKMVFVNGNSSRYSDKHVYGAVVLTSGSVMPARLRNKSLRLLGNYRAAGAAHTYYFCLGPGSSGRFWISFGSPIHGLPTVQPTVEAPYRFGIVEFTYPANGSLDTSNVNNFDFPINLQRYKAPSSRTPKQSAVFTGTTCDVLNYLRRQNRGSGRPANLKDVVFAKGGRFVRIVAPDSSTNGWPDMGPYIHSLASRLPLVTTGYFRGDRGPLVINDLYGGDPGTAANQGWFKVEGFFDASGKLTIDGGLHVQGLGEGAQKPGGTFTPIPQDMTISEPTLDIGIYQQGFTYGVGNGNDLYAWIWGDLTSAFDYGYWGSPYGNNSIDFSRPIGMGSTQTNGQPAFRPKRKVAFAPAPGGLSYNLYAAVLSRFSPSYAIPYNERWGRGGYGTSPLLDMPTGGKVIMSVPPDGWSGKSGSTTCVKKRKRR